ncbi:MAG: pyridoxamine 5'-phosphate oxidase family protein [Xanthobacteraceae bacterium]
MRGKDNVQAGIDRVWEIIDKVGVAMLTTRFSGGLRARPLEARPERAAGLIWFLTDLRSGKDPEIEAEHDVGLVFVDPEDKAYLSITARAEVRRDHAKAAEIWKSTDRAWWSGPDDPDLRVLRVRPITAELWDGPASAVLTAFEFARAWVTGAEPDLGENRKVTVRMGKTGASPRSNSTSRRNQPGETYRLIWNAARIRKQITFTYGGRYREACPHIVGYNPSGEAAVLAFQFGGASTSKPLPPKGEWRCFAIGKMTEVQARGGRWHSGEGHSKTQPCIQFVDLDVNVPDTLRHRQPLPFGSPALRPPRRSGETR